MNRKIQQWFRTIAPCFDEPVGIRASGATIFDRYQFEPLFEVLLRHVPHRESTRSLNQLYDSLYIALENLRRQHRDNCNGCADYEILALRETLQIIKDYRANNQSSLRSHNKK